MTDNCDNGFSDDDRTEHRELKVVIHVEPSAGCPINRVRPDVDISDIRIQSKSYGTNCELELVSTGDEAERTLVAHNKNIDHVCPCRIFEKHDLIPNIQAVGTDHYVADVFVSDRDDIRDLIIDLNEQSETVEILQITEVSPDVESSECCFDSSVLTEKQQRALEAAIAQGYYDPEETATLEEIADSFGITRQAYADRLQAAEHKIFSQIGDMCLADRASA